MLSLTDVLAVVFGITATIVGIAAVVATVLTRDSRRYIAYSDRESQRIDEQHDPVMKLLDILPQIVHGQGAGTGGLGQQGAGVPHERSD